MNRDDVALLLLECDALAGRVTVLEARFGADDPEVAALRCDVTAYTARCCAALHRLGPADDVEAPPQTAH
jgi:hypothetical protein